MNVTGIAGQGAPVAGATEGVAVASAVGDPTKTAAVGHCDRHEVTPGRYHVAKRPSLRDPRHFVDKDGNRETSQQRGTSFELLSGALRRVEKMDHNPKLKAPH